MNKEVEEIEQRIKDTFKDECKFILTFGSINQAKGFKNTSDVDMAIYLEDYSPQTDILKLKSRLHDITPRDCDLIVLNRADIIITMQVLMNGKLIESNDELFYTKFKAEKMSEYIDFKNYRKELEDKLLC